MGKLIDGFALMSSTHMAAGFVLSGVIYRALVQLFPAFMRPGLLLLFPYVLVAGLVGGMFPDLDRLDRELFGLKVVHRKTLHFLFGYTWTGGLAAVLLLMYPEQAWLFGPLAGFLLSAALHSTMDVFDSVDRGKPGAVYEHLTSRWIRGKRLILFGSTREWMLYSAFAIGFLVFSTYPYPVTLLGSDVLNLSLVLYVVTWVPAVIYELKYELPRRRGMQGIR